MTIAIDEMMILEIIATIALPFKSSLTTELRILCNLLIKINYYESDILETYRVVTKISSCRVNTTSRRGIKWLGISFGSNFLLFSNKVAGSHSLSSQGFFPAPGSY